MFYIVGHSLALLVLLAGLFLLAYAKKEGLGWMTKISSYIAITFGVVVFVGGIICGIMCGGCHKSNCGSKDGKCSMEMRKDCSGSSCSTKMHHGGMKGGCSGEMNHHGKMKGDCSKSCCSGDMGQCSMKDENCCKEGKMCKMEGTDKEVKIEKKVIVKDEK